MKQLFHSIILLLAAITIASCTTDTPVSISPEVADGSKPVYLSASIDNAVTRISMEDGGTAVKLTWELDDKIYVINSANGTAYAFTAIRLSDDKKSAVFRSPDGYTGTPQYAIWSGSKVLTSYNAAALPMPATAVYSSVKDLADNYWLYAKYNTSTGSLAFKPLLSILRFDLTLPAGETSIKSFRVQMQDGTEMFHTKPTYNITGANPVMTTSTSSYNFFNDNLNIALTSNRAVLYMAVGAATTTDKTMEIIINKKHIATQTCKNITAASAASIKKAAANWLNAIYSGGFGAETSPYLMSNETNLRALAASIGDGVAGSYYAGKYFELENDITINAPQNNPWNPIGYAGSSGNKIFGGRFNGAGKTITASGGSFYVNVSLDGNTTAGLFGNVISGSIHNLTLNGNLVVVGSASSASLTVGSIAGQCGGISHCEHIGSVSIPGASNGLSIGGLVGLARGSITNCKQSNGTISISGNSDVAVYVGGCFGSVAVVAHECLTKDTNITVTTSTATPIIGALAGRVSTTTVYDCCNFSGVTVKLNDASQTVKLFGTTNINATQCPDGHTKPTS